MIRPLALMAGRRKCLARLSRGGDIARGGCALANAATVALSEQIGRQNVIAMARMLGMSGTMRLEPALALGVFETSLLEPPRFMPAFPIRAERLKLMVSNVFQP